MGFEGQIADDAEPIRGRMFHLPESVHHFPSCPSVYGRKTRATAMLAWPPAFGSSHLTKSTLPWKQANRAPAWISLSHHFVEVSTRTRRTIRFPRRASAMAFSIQGDGAE